MNLRNARKTKGWSAMKNRFRMMSLLFVLVISVSFFPPGAFASRSGSGDMKITLSDSYLFDALYGELGADGLNLLTGSDADSLTLRMAAADVEKVTILRLNNRYISDISGLEVFTELEELNIANNMVTNLAVLSGMEKLAPSGRVRKSGQRRWADFVSPQPASFEPCEKQTERRGGFR